MLESAPASRARVRGANRVNAGPHCQCCRFSDLLSMPPYLAALDRRRHHRRRPDPTRRSRRQHRSSSSVAPTDRHGPGSVIDFILMAMPGATNCSRSCHIHNTRRAVLSSVSACKIIDHVVTVGHIPVEFSEATNDRAGTSNAVYVTLFIVALALWWLSNAHASVLPFWVPWDFSWIEFLSAWLTFWWYIHGLILLAPAERPSPPRQASFFAGIFAIYIVLETHFEYFAEHQFFYNRIQHVVMHHFGPLLIALAWPGTTIWQGMPAPVRRLVVNPLTIRTVRILQQPAFAAILFSGSFFFWLIPSVHFRAMIDPNLYAAMNWTMVIEGILFWCLVLDPRSSPPARASFATRAALAFAVMFPQIIFGAIITFSSRDLYSFYDLCGRIYPQLGPRVDQTVGGLIVWVPPAMMSVVAVLLVLHTLSKVEDRSPKEGAEYDDDGNARAIIQASQWTGR